MPLQWRAATAYLSFSWDFNVRGNDILKSKHVPQVRNQFQANLATGAGDENLFWLRFLIDRGVVGEGSNAGRSGHGGYKGGRSAHGAAQWPGGGPEEGGKHGLNAAKTSCNECYGQRHGSTNSSYAGRGVEEEEGRRRGGGGEEEGRRRRGKGVGGGTVVMELPWKYGH